ncbi:hypothetical protein KKH38_02205 [Patescibacteria group bacterium]|nr:hypothetical protein [Patescibacteria group bacterium]MBU4600857.1 hypothetical protein [Patescibacteria group bacterium]MCG2697838.1 hypothetical protein [Candidatus Parcubacteria bacterium]
MLSNNFVFYGTKILAELVRDIAFFPLWWYTTGLVKMIGWAKRFLSDRLKSLALLVWIKNIHRPMYGQYDWQGILISFFMRLIQIIVRSIVMLFWLVFVAAVLLFWLALPLAVVYEIVFQII